MNRTIDTLFYQWVVQEDEKRIPTIIEDIEEMDDVEKIDAVLIEYANRVADVIEAEVANRIIIDQKVQEAQADPEIAEADEDLVSQAIAESEEVLEIQEILEASKNELDLLHTSMVKVFSREV